MIYITNPLILPLLLLIWSVDCWLWLSVLKLVLDKVMPGNQFSTAASPIIESPVRIVGKYSSTWFKKPLSGPTLWTVTLIAILCLRFTLFWVVASVQPT